MIILAPNTAATLRLGPFVDNEDGYTPEVALTIQKADVRLSKNGAEFAAAHADQGTGDAGADHDENGWYEISLDATDTNTEGYLTIAIAVAGALPVWQDVWLYPTPGYGATETTYRVREVDTSEAIVSAVVRLYSDESRTILVAQATTDSLGVATFSLDPGTYYPRASYNGVSYDHTEFTVS